VLDEQAERVVNLYLTGPEESLRRNSAAQRLKRLGHEEDLDFASPRIPCRLCPGSWEMPLLAKNSWSLA
jgi:hypothetical protein